MSNSRNHSFRTKWLLIGSHSHLCCVILHAHCPCQCKTQLFNAQQNAASTTDGRKPRADSSPLSAKISSQRYCLLVFSQLPALSHSSDHSIPSDHVCVTEKRLVLWVPVSVRFFDNKPQHFCKMSRGGDENKSQNRLRRSLSKVNSWGGSGVSD